MNISAELNKKLHGMAKRAGIGHEMLKTICHRQNRDYKTITPQEGIKLYEWLAKHVADNLIYNDGKWCKPPEKIKMSNVVNKLIHKAGWQRGQDHNSILTIAQNRLNKRFCDLNDMEGWLLYYILTEDKDKITAWENAIKKQKER